MSKFSVAYFFDTFSDAAFFEAIFGPFATFHGRIWQIFSFCFRRIFGTSCVAKPKLFRLTLAPRSGAIARAASECMCVFVCMVEVSIFAREARTSHYVRSAPRVARCMGYKLLLVFSSISGDFDGKMWALLLQPLPVPQSTCVEQLTSNSDQFLSILMHY